MNKFFAVCRCGCNYNSTWIDDRRAAAKPQVVIFADAVGCDDVALVLDCACDGERAKMFDTRKRPRRRNDKSVDVMFGHQFSVHLRKAKVVADTETKVQTAKLKAREGVARSKTGLFFDRRDRV